MTTQDDIDTIVKNLKSTYIEAKPITYDWPGERYDYDEEGSGWQSFDSAECEKCGHVLVVAGEEHGEHRQVFDLNQQDEEECDKCGGEGHDDEAEDLGADGEQIACPRCNGSGMIGGESKCVGYVSSSAPMMSYFYPCEWDDVRDAASLKGLPLCLVEVEGTKGLALTGGGMDLSWEVCAAYIRLGYLPPAHFAGKLPRMAGMERHESTRLVLAAAYKSCEVAVRWAQNALEEVVRLTADIALKAAR